MNMNKQDFAMAMIAVGMTEHLNDADTFASVLAGNYVTSTEEQQIKLLHSVKEATDKAIAMLQQFNLKLDAELLAHVKGGK